MFHSSPYCNLNLGNFGSILTRDAAMKTDETSSISELDAVNFNVFPNPSKDGRFYLENYQDIHQIKVYSLDGKLVEADFDKAIGMLKVTTAIAGIYAAQLLDKNGKLLSVVKLFLHK
jgi:hypothetical protein